MYNKRELKKTERSAVKSNPWAKDRVVTPGAPKVDPNGYWDPANIGRIIEVPSPKITMQGVEEPLVGVGSDTGMTQYMMPGQDYMFPNDSSVVEYPEEQYMDLTDDEIAEYKAGGYVVEELNTPIMAKGGPRPKPKPKYQTQQTSEKTLESKYDFNRLNESIPIQRNFNELPVGDSRRAEYDQQRAAYQKAKEEYDKKVQDYEQQNRLYNWSQQDYARREASQYGPYDEYMQNQPEYLNDERSYKRLLRDYNDFMNPNYNYPTEDNQYYSPYFKEYTLQGNKADEIYNNLIKSKNEYKSFDTPEGMPRNSIDDLNFSSKYLPREIEYQTENFSGFPNYGGLKLILKPDSDYTSSYYTTDDAKNKVLNPSTKEIEKNFNIDDVKKIFPNLSQEYYDQQTYQSNNSYIPVYRSLKTDHDGEYVDPYATTDTDLETLNGKTYVVEDGRKYYIPDNLELDFRTDLDFEPFFNKPQEVEQFTQTSPNASFEDKQLINTLAKQYDPETKKWVDVVTPIGSTLDKQTQAAEAYRQKNLEYQKSQGLDRDKESSHEKPEVVPTTEESYKNKRPKFQWNRGRYRFDNGGYIADETYYPPKHNPANSFAVNDPRSMYGGGYVDAQMVHFQSGGNTDPGDNALELHMFYDKDVYKKQDGGHVGYYSDNEIEDLRRQGYIVEEE